MLAPLLQRTEALVVHRSPSRIRATDPTRETSTSATPHDASTDDPSPVARDAADAFIHAAIARLIRQVDPQSPACRRFLEELFHPDAVDASQLAHRLGVRPNTLACRFFRAGLPSPKRYVIFARLLRAIYLAESSRLTVATIAKHLHASSPQSFTRTVRSYTGLTAKVFLGTRTSEQMLRRFETELILPYRTVLWTFDPIRLAST